MGSSVWRWVGGDFIDVAIFAYCDGRMPMWLWSRWSRYELGEPGSVRIDTVDGGKGQNPHPLKSTKDAAPLLMFKRRRRLDGNSSLV